MRLVRSHGISDLHTVYTDGCVHLKKLSMQSGVYALTVISMYFTFLSLKTLKPERDFISLSFCCTIKVLMVFSRNDRVAPRHRNFARSIQKRK